MRVALSYHLPSRWYYAPGYLYSEPSTQRKRKRGRGGEEEDEGKGRERQRQRKRGREKIFAKNITDFSRSIQRRKRYLVQQ